MNREKENRQAGSKPIARLRARVKRADAKAARREEKEFLRRLMSFGSTVKFEV